MFVKLNPDSNAFYTHPLHTLSGKYSISASDLQSNALIKILFKEFTGTAGRTIKSSH